VPLLISKTSAILSDGIHASGPMAIPGASMRYCILISNPGTLAATDVYATDVLPASISYLPGSTRWGSTCATATATGMTGTSGASFTGGTLTGYVARLAAGASFAIRFDAQVN
jgi:uncharacterized repeat protein (TIGR01451 family)